MQKKNIVLFDMDHTLVSANTAELWGEYLDKKGMVTDQELAQWKQFHTDYIAGKLDITASYEFELAMLKKIQPSVRKQWVADFFTHHVKQHISSTGLRLVQEYKNQPHTLVVLITATLHHIATTVASHVAFHDLIATQAEMMGDEYTGKLDGIPSLGPGKAQRFEQWAKAKNIVPAYTILYSDSINDLPLLTRVDKPIAVDPDNHLRQVATERNWDIISLRDQGANQERVEAIRLDTFVGL